MHASAHLIVYVLHLAMTVRGHTIQLSNLYSWLHSNNTHISNISHICCLIIIVRRRNPSCPCINYVTHQIFIFLTSTSFLHPINLSTKASRDQIHIICKHDNLGILILKSYSSKKLSRIGNVLASPSLLTNLNKWSGTTFWEPFMSLILWDPST